MALGCHRPEKVPVCRGPFNQKDSEWESFGIL
jgi:hypothetical protein